MKKAFLWFGLTFTLLALGNSSVVNTPDLRKQYALTPEYDGVQVDQRKVAILDSGFEEMLIREKGGNRRVKGIKPGVLPASATIVEDYTPYFQTKRKFLKAHNHGGLMAQSVWAMTNNDPLGPQFYLLNAANDMAFRDAVRYAYQVAKLGPGDIIVCSETFEYGGDFKGNSYFNDLVHEATSRGIIWIQAAGNYRGYVYNGPAEKTTVLHLRSNVDNNIVQLKLAFPGISNFTHELGTENDYDLEVYDSKGTLLTSTFDNMGNEYPIINYKQVNTLPAPKPKEKKEAEVALSTQSGDKSAAIDKVVEEIEIREQAAEPIPPPKEDEEVAKKDAPENKVEKVKVKETPYPFEAFTVVLDQNDPKDPEDTYLLRIVQRNGVFAEKDQVRLTVIPSQEVPGVVDESGKFVPAVELREASPDSQIMVIADDPNVITVGDTGSYSAIGPTLDGRVKPDIIMGTSTVVLSTGYAGGGSSQAAALLAGIVVVLEAAAPHLERKHIVQFVQDTRLEAQTVTSLVQGSVPVDAKPISMDQLRRSNGLFPYVIDPLLKNVPDTQFIPFVRSDGSFILGLNRPPAQLTGLFRNFPWNLYGHRLHELDYWVTAGHPVIPGTTMHDMTSIRTLWTVRDRMRPEARYPWEGLRDYSKQDFIEFRHLQWIQEQVEGQLVERMWKTPTKTELRRVIAEG